MSLLETLRNLITDFSDADRNGHRFEDNDYRLAAAALLVHVISLDGEPSAAERDKLRSLLEARFDLDQDTANDLIREATLVEGEAVDLYQFTSLILRSVNEDGRLRIIEMMWELVYADGHLSEFEDSVIWRAADLLGISARARLTIKHRVAGRHAADPVPGEPAA